MIITLIDNISFLILLIFFHSYILPKYYNNIVIYKILTGLLFGVVSFICKTNPIILNNGIALDERALVVSVAGLLGGPITSLIALFLGVLLRFLVIGGVGSILKIISLTMVAGTGTYFYVKGQSKSICSSILKLFLFGFVTQLQSMISLLVHPAVFLWIFFKTFSLPFFIIYPFGSVILGKLLYDQECSFIAARELNESEKRFRTAFSESPYPIIIHDENGKILFVNKVWEELSGYKYEDIPTIDDWTQKAYGNNSEEIKKGILSLYRIERRVDRGEFEISTRSGEKKIWDFSSAPLGVDKNGTRMVIRVAKDMTEYKKAEMHSKKLLTAIEHATDTFMITDTQGLIEYVNPAFERASGYSKEEVLGKNPRILKSHQHNEEFYQNLWDTITGGRTWSCRIINKRKDGTLFQEDTSISPVYDSSDRIINYVAVNRDVTKEIEMESQLSQSQKMETIGRLAGGIAHDFNNILTAILGYSNLAIVKIPEHDSLHDDLVQIEKAALRAANLTNQLLAFSRKQILNPVIVDLNEMIINIGKMLCRLIGENIEYATIPCKGLWKVKADIGQMEQVLTNLVINARDAMPMGGRLTIETQNVFLNDKYTKIHMNAAPDEFVMLSISDTGTGIKKEILDKIFDPYFTTKEQGKGTGLGLSMVHGIVKQSGGNISVYTEEDWGTTFTIYLPRVPHESDTGALTKDFVYNCPGTETILLVEDEEMVRRLVYNSLESAGYKVLTASQASHAIKIFEESDRRIHLLLTDVVMPKMSGKELADILVDKKNDLKVRKDLAIDREFLSS